MKARNRKRIEKPLENLDRKDRHAKKLEKSEDADVSNKNGVAARWCFTQLV